MNMKHFSISLILCMLCTASALAQTLVVSNPEAGMLEDQLSEHQINTTTSITVTGKINYQDIAIFTAMSRDHALAEVNLSSAQWQLDSVLDNPDEFFLPCIAVLGKPMDPTGFQYEQEMGHNADPRSMTGFWVFNTGKNLFNLSGYMDGWDRKISEAVLKTEHADYLLSPQVLGWLHSMGYVYKQTLDDGDRVYHNAETNVWVLLHLKPYNNQDYPGIHFSLKVFVNYNTLYIS